jgi:pSer/pThr/pTyr-binding forkhead associated (FHA) protein
VVLKLVDVLGEAVVINRLTTVGREMDGNDWVIPHAHVSRYHATLEPHGEGVLVEDLISHNGTYLNGVKLECKALAKPGDMISFSRTLTYRVEKD